MSDTIKEGDTFDLNLFPTPVRLVSLPQKYADVCSFFDEQKHNPDTGGNTKNYGSHSKNTYVLDDPVCKEFKKYMLGEIGKFNDEILGYDVKEWAFSQTWVSHKEPGQKHIMHTHPNSMISGVFFYGGVAEKTSAIQFHSPISFSGFNTMQVEKKFNGKNPNTWTSFSVSFDVGKCVLFPSYFQHSVPVNETDMTRKSVSMNIVPKGGVGSKNSLTELLFNRVK